jgi:hypothetical protein
LFLRIGEGILQDEKGYLLTKTCVVPDAPIEFFDELVAGFAIILAANNLRHPRHHHHHHPNSKE